MWDCVFSVYPFSLWWLREYIYIYIYLSYYHHQIGSMNYYPLFRVRSWNNGMRCMSFYILLKIIPREHSQATQASTLRMQVLAICCYITEICAELLLARWAPHFDYNSPAGNFWVVAGSNDPWRCALANPSMGSWINSAGVLPHFAEDDPSVEALEGGRTVRQWIT